MQRTKFKEVTNRQPLVENTDEGMDSPKFLDDLENDKFKDTPKNFTDSAGRERESLIFKNSFCKHVYYLTKLGARNEDIAEFFGVGKRTVDWWAETNQDFKEAVAQGRYVFGFKVAETLGQRALGYDYTEVEFSQHVDRYGRIRKLKKITHKHMPPDTVAIIFYLKNRHREAWSDRFDIDAKLQVTAAKEMNFEVLTQEEQALVKSIAIKKVSQVHGISNN